MKKLLIALVTRPDIQQFKNLRGFYSDVSVLEYDCNKPCDWNKIGQTADVSVKVWQLAGIKWQDLQLICKAAALVQDCLREVLVKLTAVVEDVACLFPQVWFLNQFYRFPFLDQMKSDGVTRLHQSK